jgi:(4-alkanoyl-5-oxo-2,5-dihydrofuran-3-yl)methyl phosphate reductase
VRAGGFMSNTYQWLASIKAEGVIYNPMGNGPVASIDPEDIAAVAVYALTAPVLTETVFEVTGGELLTTADKARILSKYVGKEVRTVDVPPEKAVEGLKANGIPAHVAAALGQSFEAIRAGRATQRTDTVERVTGRKPRTFEEWAQQHAARFA